MDKKSLTSFFDEDRQNLEHALKEYRLPKDREAICATVISRLNSILAPDGLFRGGLTQSEDHILQAALQVLHTQQMMGKKIADLSVSQSPCSSSPQPESLVTKSAPCAAGAAVLSGVTLAVGVGAPIAIPAMIASLVGALVGQIAYDKYGSSGNNGKNANKIEQTPLDVTRFVPIVRQLCETIDGLMDTFRIQIQKVVDLYEAKEKPSLEKDYIFLLEQIQSLLGRAGRKLEDREMAEKLYAGCRDLAEVLENYDLLVVSPDPEADNSRLFEVVASERVNGLVQILPAIVKSGNVVLKGKILMPKEEAHDEQ